MTKGIVVAALILVSCSSQASATHPTPTPLPATPLTAPATAAVTDITTTDINGTSAPGATIAASWSTGSTSATADANGVFVLHLTNLDEGDTTVTIAASLPSDQPTTAHIDVQRQISQAGYKAQASSIPYNQLVKDPSSLAGKIVTYRAQVFQYDSNTTTSHMIASVTDSGYGFWNDNVWLDLDPSAAQNVFQKTVVQFWGSVVGPYTYTTSQNGSLTIPEIAVKYIQVAG